MATATITSGELLLVPPPLFSVLLLSLLLVLSFVDDF